MRPIRQVWNPPDTVSVTDDILIACGGSLILAETLIRRGINSPEKIIPFLDPDRYQPSDPFDLPDMEIGIERIESSIQRGELIGVWGDFDLDGQTSTTILVSALRSLGGKVEYYIPVRSRETHGISIQGLEYFKQKHIRLIVTCDTGITAHEPIDYAKSLGMDTVVTDHHTLPPELPPALANINPQRLHNGHPLYPISGVGVAYKLIEALFTRFNRQSEVLSYLDLVCLGTVADVASLTGENRWFVQKGLKLIRSSPRPAIKALLKAADVDHTLFTEEHISFVVAPRLNALGRLGDANSVYDFLAADKLDQDVIAFSNSLEKMNAERVLLCDHVYNSALKYLKDEPHLLEKPAIILSGANWPSSILGIAASKLVNIYNKPVILLTSNGGEQTRGSARSVEGINISELIAASQNYLSSFGGHPMAAGLSLKIENVPEFSNSFFQSVNFVNKTRKTRKVVNIDALIKFNQLNAQLIEEIGRLAPFGNGNPAFHFATKGLRIEEAVPIGKYKDHLQIGVKEIATGDKENIFWWNGAGFPLPDDDFDLIYSARSSNFRGKSKVQIEWIDSKPVDDIVFEIKPLSSNIEIIDYRNTSNQKNVLLDLMAGNSIQVWAEGDHDIPEIGKNRTQLIKSDTLAIYTSPAGQAELREVLYCSQPVKIYLFSNHNLYDSLRELLRNIWEFIIQIIKYNSGLMLIKDVSMETGQNEKTILSCLYWFEAKGKICLSQGDFTGQYRINIDSQVVADYKSVEKDIMKLLEETRAYRKYYSRMDKQRIIELL